jgi:hypothetical protein
VAGRPPGEEEGEEEEEREKGEEVGEREEGEWPGRKACVGCGGGDGEGVTARRLLVRPLVERHCQRSEFLEMGRDTGRRV